MSSSSTILGLSRINRELLSSIMFSSRLTKKLSSSHSLHLKQPTSLFSSSSTTGEKKLYPYTQAEARNINKQKHNPNYKNHQGPPPIRPAHLTNPNPPPQSSSSSQSSTSSYASAPRPLANQVYKKHSSDFLNNTTNPYSPNPQTHQTMTQTPTRNGYKHPTVHRHQKPNILKPKLERADFSGPFDFHIDTPTQEQSHVPACPTIQHFKGMSIIMLGTSSGVPSLNRNVSSLALRLGGGTWLFDCGEGTQRQIMRTAAITPGEIKKIFITHMHGDHLFGLQGVLLGCSMSANSVKKREDKFDGDFGRRNNNNRNNNKRNNNKTNTMNEPESEFGEDDDEDVNEVLREIELSASSNRTSEIRKLKVYGPPGIYNYICATLKLSQATTPVPIEVYEMRGGTQEHGNNKQPRLSEALMQPIDVLQNNGVTLHDIYPDDAGVWVLDDGKDSSQSVLTKDVLSHMLAEDQQLAKDLSNNNLIEQYNIPIKRTKSMDNGVNRGIRVEAAEIHHVRGIQTFGFVVTESPSFPRIVRGRAQKLGLSPGIKFEMLKMNIPVLSDDGLSTVHPRDVLLEESLDHGRKVCILGDCRSVGAGMKSIAKNCDVLVHEATLGDEFEMRAMKIGHSTPEMAAFAASNVCREGGLLLLNHFSGRYTPYMTDFIRNAQQMLFEHAKKANDSKSKTSESDEVHRHITVIPSRDLQQIFVPNKIGKRVVRDDDHLYESENTRA